MNCPDAKCSPKDEPHMHEPLENVLLPSLLLGTVYPRQSASTRGRGCHPGLQFMGDLARAKIFLGPTAAQSCSLPNTKAYNLLKNTGNSERATAPH